MPPQHHYIQINIITTTPSFFNGVNLKFKDQVRKNKFSRTKSKLKIKLKNL